MAVRVRAAASPSHFRMTSWSAPDCGAPYHRVCYEKLGQCIHRPAHAAGYEWKFPYEESQLRTCPSCGERTLRDEETCRCCGAVLPPRGAGASFFLRQR